MPEEPFASQTIRPHQLLGRTSSHGPDGRAKKLVVPPFQRAFSWETAQVEALWEDVTSFMESDTGPGAYFVGPIVYMYDSSGDQILLLDGQQRFATITIILAALRNLMFDLKDALGRAGDSFAYRAHEVGRDIEKDYLFLEDEPEKIYALTLNREDASFFVHAVISHPRETSGALLKSHRRILRARDNIDRLLRGLLAQKGYLDGAGNLQVSKASQITDLTKNMVAVLTRSLAMTAIRVSGEDEAFIIFETLNDRGMRLAISDLVLNFLMREAGGDDRELVRNSWGELLGTLEKEDTADFLRRFWISQHGDVKQGSLFSHIRKAVEGGLSPLDLSRDLAEQAKVYTDLLDPDPGYFGEAAQHLQALTGPLGDRRSIPLLLAAHRQLGPNTGEFRDLARALVGLVIRYQILGGRDPAAMEKVLFGLAKDVSAGLGLTETISRLRELSPPDESLRSDLEKPRKLKKAQATFMLYKIAEHYQKGKDIWNLNLNSVSLEHIFPQKAQEDAWPQRGALTPHLWSLGNLTALERGLNRKAGNKSFQEKAEAYRESEIALTRDIPERWSDWSTSSVVERTEELFDIAGVLWPEELI